MEGTEKKFQITRTTESGIGLSATLWVKTIIDEENVIREVVTQATALLRSYIGMDWAAVQVAALGTTDNVTVTISQG